MQKDSPIMIEDAEKDLYSVTSGSGTIEPRQCILTHSGYAKLTSLSLVEFHHGIDAEIANFFAEAAPVTKDIVIDEVTNRRLRWMIHKRVLLVMVVTYFAQTLDKGYANIKYVLSKPS